MFAVEKFTTALEGLAALKPAFKENGTVTAGNSSGINDGASGLILMSVKKAEDLGIQVMARIVSTAASRAVCRMAAARGNSGAGSRCGPGQVGLSSRR